MKEPKLAISPFEDLGEFKKALDALNKNGELAIRVDIRELKKIKPFSQGDWIVICFDCDDHYEFICVEIKTACPLVDSLKVKTIEFA